MTFYKILSDKAVSVFWKGTVATLCIVVMSLFIMSAGCTKKENDLVEPDIPGVLPSSIDQVLDVFELKYGEEKEWHYNGQTLKFTVTDVEDSLKNCAPPAYAYIPPDEWAKFINRIRMYTYMRVETNNTGVQLKITSQACGVREYRNDGTDIQEVWDLLESWQNIAGNPEDATFFQEQFSFSFGTGTLLKNISCSIYMVKADPMAYKSVYDVEKRRYKFIYIITEN
jgi:hypothetical protein